MQVNSFTNAVSYNIDSQGIINPCNELDNDQSSLEIPSGCNSEEDTADGTFSLSFEDDNSENSSDYNKRRKLGAALYSVHLQERCMLARSAVQLVEERTTSLIRWSLLHIQAEVLGTLENCGLDLHNEIPVIREIVEHEMNPFEGIDTAWLKDQFIKQHLPYVVSY